MTTAQVGRGRDLTCSIVNRTLVIIDCEERGGRGKDGRKEGGRRDEGSEIGGERKGEGVERERKRRERGRGMMEGITRKGDAFVGHFRPA